MALSPGAREELSGILSGEGTPSGGTPQTRLRKPKSTRDEISAILNAPTEPPTPTPEGGVTQTKGVGQSLLGRYAGAFGEMGQEAVKQFVASQEAPTYGSELQKRFPALGKYTPIPGAMDLIARAARLPGSVARGGAELGPETAKPLTEQLLGGLMNLSPLLRRPEAPGARIVGELPIERRALPGPPRGVLGPSEMQPRPPGYPGRYASWTNVIEPEPLPPGSPLKALPETSVVPGPKTAMTWTDLAEKARSFDSAAAFKSYALRTPAVRTQLREGGKTAEGFYKEATAPPKPPEAPPKPVQPIEPPVRPVTPTAPVAAQPAQPTGMWVTIGGQRYPVASFEEASTKFQQVIKAANVGYSEAQTPLILDDSGSVIGHIAYNGKIFPGHPQNPQTYKPVKPLYSPYAAERAAPPRFEKTEAGQQGVMEGMGGREMPKTPIRRPGQSAVEDSPLFNQAKAARERAAEEAQTVLPTSGTTMPPRVMDLLRQWASAEYKGVGKKLSKGELRELRDAGFATEDANHAFALTDPAHKVFMGLVKEIQAAKAVPKPGTAEAQGFKIGGFYNAGEVTPPVTTIKTRPGAFQIKGGFEHGIPSLRDPDDVYSIVQRAGRLKVTEDYAGELRDVSAFFKSKNGKTLDQIAESLADEYPALGERGAIKEQLVDTLRRYPTLKAEKKAAAGRMDPIEVAEQQKVTEIRTSTPPGDVPVSAEEWRVMGPVERKSAIEFFREAFLDQGGRLDLQRMAKALKGFRQKFPMDTAVLKERPNSPVIAEVERWNTTLADWMAGRVALSWQKGVRRANPELLKNAEEAAVREWQANGGTHAAEIRARRHFPPDIQASMRQRDVLFDRANESRAFFGLPPVPRSPGPYLPRSVISGRDAVSLRGGGQLGVGRALQTSPPGHMQERAFGTYREGEAAGLEYNDPRNEILLRDWDDFKIRATHQLFRNLEAKGTLFRDTSAADAEAAMQSARRQSRLHPSAPYSPAEIEAIGETARRQSIAATKARVIAASPTQRAIAIEDAPGGRWWTTTEAEAKFLHDNLTESPRGPDTSLVAYANGLIRSPNLVNPFPHILKNMAMKELLAQGPVSMSRVAYDAVEWARGWNPKLLRDFEEAMPFSAQGKTAEQMLGQELRAGSFQDGLRKGMYALGHLGALSRKAIFEWADPAMRYSLYKHYRRLGKDVYEAGNHAWVDLIRYGVRSVATDTWKLRPLNFFVPWRFGTFASLVKQVRNHPVRTALLIGAVDYLREVRYRQNGKWTHVPWDYVEAPIAHLIQSKGKGEFAKNLGSEAALTTLFGPGGAFAASQLDEMLRLASGKEDPRNPQTYARLMNLFWGLQQLYNLPQEAVKGDYSGMLLTFFLGEHNALTYQPKRLGPGFGLIPESVLEHMPGMQKSPLVQEAERMQAEKQARAEKAAEHRKDKPRSTIEDKLRAAGYLK